MKKQIPTISGKTDGTFAHTKSDRHGNKLTPEKNGGFFDRFGEALGQGDDGLILADPGPYISQVENIRNSLANQPTLFSSQRQQAPVSQVSNPLLDQMIKHFSVDDNETADGQMGELFKQAGY